MHPTRVHPHRASLKPQTHNLPPPHEVAQGLGLVCWCTGSQRGGGCFHAPLPAAAFPTSAPKRRPPPAGACQLGFGSRPACFEEPACLFLLASAFSLTRIKTSRELTVPGSLAARMLETIPSHAWRQLRPPALPRAGDAPAEPRGPTKAGTAACALFFFPVISVGDSQGKGTTKFNLCSSQTDV